MDRKTAFGLSTGLGLAVLLALLLLAGPPHAAAESDAVMTIAAARALPDGTTVTVEGIVTVAAGTYNAGFAIQDGTAGIYIYPSSFVDVTLGDTVIVTGPLDIYNCLVEVAPAPANVRVTGTAPVPAPRPYDTGDINDATEGWLVVVTGTVSSLSGSSLTLNDGSGPAYVYVDADTGVSLAGIANGDSVRLVGESSHYGTAPACSSGWQVMPRQQSDVLRIDHTPPTVLSTIPLPEATNVSPHKPIYATFSEALDPATVNAATFVVTQGSTPVAGTVTYDAAARQAVFTPSSPLAQYQRHTARLTTGIEDAAGNALAADYSWSFTAGKQDTTPPSIAGRSPAAEATNVSLSANVVITFSEEMNPATIVPANFTLTGPYGALVWDAVTYNAAARKVTLNPRGLLLPTARYTATVSAGVTDWAGLPVPVAQRTWSFTTQAEPAMVAFHGDLHNHTSYSDGSGMPQQAFASGQECGLDFLAVTDHSYAISDAEWADILAQAGAATQDGVFVGLRGFEYTQGAEGHANVYNTVRHATRAEVPTCTYCDYTPNLERGVTVDGFYHWLSITGTQALDGSGTMLQFNHPSWINFNDWVYHPEVEEVAELEEVGNGWDTSYAFSWDEWIRSLDYGWQVGATNNSDNHNLGWGCISPHRTGVVMAALTRDDLLAALRARRTFATEDSNYDLYFKANGYWMGSEMPNTGQMAFHVWGSDPDGEPTTLVQIVTVQGQVVAELAPNAATFDWNVSKAIQPGRHYYLILAVEADGDRIVSSPVWTMGTEDVAVTDLTIQPSIPTIYNPSLLTARITNRGQTTQTLTVAFQANGVSIGTVPVTIAPCTTGPCEDDYATISWQSTLVGPVTVTAAIETAPAGDNADDNSRRLRLEVSDVKIPLVLIDAGHNNLNIDPNGMRQFVNDMTLHGYNVLFNLDQITASDLNTDTVKLLIISAYGPDQFSAGERQAIVNYVAAGGSLWLNGMSDYSGSVSWAHTSANRINQLATDLETIAGPIPIRFNDDEVLDGNDNNGYPWGVLWHTFPSSMTQGVGVNVLKIQSWSDASLVDGAGTALTQEDLGANGSLMVIGDLDAGSTDGEPNATHSTDADGEGDAFFYPANIPVPFAAGYDLPGPAGRLLFYGDSNDLYNMFAYVSGDGKQNELLNLEIAMWLLGEPLRKETVAEARYDPELDDIPANLDRLVWVEGTVTAGYGEFFDVLYVQDDTGGITVFAPAGTASGAVEPEFQRGDCVRVVGTIDTYQGDTEIQFFETEQVKVLPGTCAPPEELSVTGNVPRPMTTNAASEEANEGWLVVVTGTVTAKSGSDTVWLDDQTGPARLFLDGYNGNWDDMKVGDRLRVAGMVSEDGRGQRIRVRNHNMHPGLPDDVLRLPQVYKQVTPQAGVPLGGVVTYTLTVSNNNTLELAGVELTDILPPEVDFGGWISQPAGAGEAGDTVTWAGSVAAGSEVILVFTATVGTDEGYRARTVTNIVTFDSSNAGAGWNRAALTVEPYAVYLPLAVKRHP